jgi:alkylation response protein AidB-like acyl-CoA dehydrogenase
MDVKFTDTENAFRLEVREFFRSAMPEDVRERVLLGQKPTREDMVTWQRILAKKGWGVPMWPVEWGGTGWTPVQHYIFTEELLQAPALPPLPHINQVGVVIIAQGTDEQKNHFLPKIRNLDYWFCQGFSEPGSGSDLASLKTRAERQGDHYIVNGSKLWTSQAHYADWMYALVRTDPGAGKHTGISYLLIDMKSPGITRRPVISIDGLHHLNQVFFDNVKVPVANRLGEENKGWNYAKHTLSHERAIIARVGQSKYRVRAAKTIAQRIDNGGTPLSEDRRLRERLAGIEVELKALEITNMRVIDGMKHAGTQQDPKGSILKLKGTELQQATLELLLDMAAQEAMPQQTGFYTSQSREVLRDTWTATIAPSFYMSRAASIYGGSNEIQHNIIAKRVLGL